MNKAWLFSFLLVFTAAVPKVFADILVFQSSDNHSEYEHVPNFIKSTSALSQEFRLANPTGPILHLVNGDLAGPSQWTDLDRGALGYDIFARLSNNPGSQVVLNLGNHEAFDYTGETGNSLFRKQVLAFKRRTKGAVRNSNVDAGPAGRDLFEAFHDITTPSGKTLRISGLVLDDLFRYSNYSPSAPSQVLEWIRPMLDAAKAQLEQAATDSVHAVIFQCHETFEVTQALVKDLLDWKAKQPRLAKLSIPVVFAAHDHEVHQGKVGDTVIVDSGSSYAYSRVLLDDNGNVKIVEHMSHDRQRSSSAFDRLRQSERLALTLTERLLVKVSRLNSRIIMTDAVAFSETRKELKQGRQSLGIKIADMLADWARESLTNEKLEAKPGEIISFYNSSTYRGTAPFQAGKVTLGELKAIYPFPGKAVLLLMPGERIQQMFTTLREYGIAEKQYTPQLPSHVKEGANRQLLVRAADGRWMPLEPNRTYPLALDPWLGINGNKIPGPEWDIATARSITPALNEHLEVIIKYLPKHLRHNDPNILCEIIATGG